ncbi:MAG: cation transporting ATPase C-terminal domain-containing protein [Desulfomonilaceae bacterium]
MHWGVPPGYNPLFFLFTYNWSGFEVATARTMAFVTLSMCELFRAFTVRSDRLFVLKIGLFSNRFMVGPVLFSVALLVITVVVPFLNPISNTRPLSFTEWSVVMGLALIPAIIEEITKLFQRPK